MNALPVFDCHAFAVGIRASSNWCAAPGVNHHHVFRRRLPPGPFGGGPCPRPARCASGRCPAARKTLRRESIQPGWIEAFEFTPLLAKLPSYVQELYVDIGDRVKADQPLAELFLPELKDELRQKEAAQSRGPAQIELAAAAVRAAEATVETARANVKLAEAGKVRAGPTRPAGGRSICGSAGWWPAARWTANCRRRRRTRLPPRRRRWSRPARRWRPPRPPSGKARPTSPRPRPASRWPRPAGGTPKPTFRVSRRDAVYPDPRPV